jgi:hypothetical protein
LERSLVKAARIARSGQVGLGSGDLSAQHRDLVSQHEPAEELAQDQVEESASWPDIIAGL